MKIIIYYLKQKKNIKIDKAIFKASIQKNTILFTES